MKKKQIEVSKAEPFNTETMEALMSLGKVLQRIHNRLVSEGVEIEVDEQYKAKKNN